MKVRSIRRHHKRRMKERAKKIAKLKIDRIDIRYGNPSEIIERHVKNADHLAKCSCGGCRPRKWEGDTKQEKLHKINTKEQLNEINI